MARSDRKAARSSLERYLRLKGTDPRALRELAYLDALERRYPEAVQSLEKAIIAKPDWAELYFDAASGNSHRKSTSPLMDRGANGLTSNLTVDLEGRLCIFNGPVDMNA